MASEQKMESIILDSSDEFNSSSDGDNIYSTMSDAGSIKLERVHKSKVLPSKNPLKEPSVEDVYGEGQRERTLKDQAIDSGKWPPLEVSCCSRAKQKLKSCFCPMSKPLTRTLVIIPSAIFGPPIALFVITAIGCLLSGFKCQGKKSMNFVEQNLLCFITGLLACCLCGIAGLFATLILECRKKVTVERDRREANKTEPMGY